MILRSPPQFGQCPMSISNTRLSRPTQPHRAVVRTARLALGAWRGLRGCLSLLRHLLRHHQRAQLGIRCQNTMEPNELQPRPGHQRSQPLHEIQRRHHQVRRAFAPRRLQLEHHLARGVDLYALVGKRRAGDASAQLPQRLPIVGRAGGGLGCTGPRIESQFPGLTSYSPTPPDLQMLLVERPLLARQPGSEDDHQPNAKLPGHRPRPDQQRHPAQPQRHHLQVLRPVVQAG